MIKIRLFIFLLIHFLSLNCFAQYNSFYRSFGGNNNFVIFSIDTLEDGGYILTGSDYGFHGANFTIIKTNFDGNEIWRYENNQFNGSYLDNHLYRIRETLDHGFIGIGSITVSQLNYYDALIVKLDSNGTLEWNRQYDFASFDAIDAIYLNSDTTYTLWGRTQGKNLLFKINNQGDTIWTAKKPIISNSILFTPGEILKINNQYYLGGLSDSTAGNYQYLSLLKFDSIGGFNWKKDFYDTGTVYTNGYYRFTQDSFLINISLMRSLHQPLGYGYYYKFSKFDLQGNISTHFLPEYYGKFDSDSTVMTLYDGRINQDSLYVGKSNFYLGTHRNYSRFFIPDHNIGDLINDKNKNILVCGSHGSFGSAGFLLKAVDTLNIGISESETKYPLKVFPNPSTDCIKFQFDAETFSEIKEYDLEIYNVIGELVQTSKKIKVPEFILDLSKFQKGFYIFKIQLKNRKILSGKLVLN